MIALAVIFSVFGVPMVLIFIATARATLREWRAARFDTEAQEFLAGLEDRLPSPISQDNGSEEPPPVI